MLPASYLPARLSQQHVERHAMQLAAVGRLVHPCVKMSKPRRFNSKMRAAGAKMSPSRRSCNVLFGPVRSRSMAAVAALPRRCWP